MTTKSVVPRAQASADAESAIDHYLSQGATDAARGLLTHWSKPTPTSAATQPLARPAMGMNWVWQAYARGR
ncbi:hypothetical protein [Candidatus Aalborgicola defluviihabitans]|uniref:hypothetical protein n=1 Tax=Candidatus Aalborgicola defluviihabitans TaxID=3386187 RepID=UPI0039B9840B